jgi:hypothetical protein
MRQGTETKSVKHEQGIILARVFVVPVVSRPLRRELQFRLWSCLPRCHIGLQHFQRLRQLRVAALRQGGRQGPQDVVRDGAVFLHVLAVIDREPAARWEPQCADVENRCRASADYGAGRGDADELASFQRLDGVAEDLGIRAAVLIAQHHDGLVPGDIDFAIEGIAGAAAARDGDGVVGLSEGGEEVIGD